MKLFTLLLLVSMQLQWEPDFENAKKIATEKNELILLNFSGSDWCAPCIQTRKEYFENEDFLKMAKTNLVMVNADFPRSKKNKLAPEQVERNETLAEKYNKDGHFPYTLLLNADGKVIKSWEGKPAVAVEKWTKEIKTICDANK